jgi:hypothetical protein
MSIENAWRRFGARQSQIGFDDRGRAFEPLCIPGATVIDHVVAVKIVDALLNEIHY